MSGGLPQLPGGASKLFSSAGLLLADAALILSWFAPPAWGVYLKGKPIALADSFLSFDFRRQWQLPTYPVEDGGFGTYNKVATPYDARVTLTKGGSTNDRAAFLAAIDAAAASLNLYTILTPEKTYLNANIARYDYRRVSTGGVTLLTVDLSLEEIRVTTTSATTAKTASGASQSNSGYVQGSAATPEQAAKKAT